MTPLACTSDTLQHANALFNGACLVPCALPRLWRALSNRSQSLVWLTLKRCPPSPSLGAVQGRVVRKGMETTGQTIGVRCNSEGLRVLCACLCMTPWVGARACLRMRMERLFIVKGISILRRVLRWPTATQGASPPGPRVLGVCVTNPAIIAAAPASAHQPLQPAAPLSVDACIALP